MKEGNGFHQGGQRNYGGGFYKKPFVAPQQPAPFPVPESSVYNRLGPRVGGNNGNGNWRYSESDKYEELLNNIDYNDNGNVINIKASIGQSGLSKLKEYKSYVVRVRLPATTPLSVVKRVLCAKFYLTKMMSVAKYSTDKNSEFYQEESGGVYMENRNRRIDLMSQIAIDNFQLRNVNHPSLFVSESETLHTMLNRHPFLQRATPQGGEISLVLR